MVKVKVSVTNVTLKPTYTTIFMNALYWIVLDIFVFQRYLVLLNRESVYFLIFNPTQENILAYSTSTILAQLVSKMGITKTLKRNGLKSKGLFQTLSVNPIATTTLTQGKFLYL